MMLSLFGKEKTKPKLVTIDIAPDHVTFAQIQYNDAHIPVGVVSATELYTDIKELPNVLMKIVSKNNFQNFDCSIVLHPDYYHLLLVDIPQVPEEEYKQALRWQIKGMVNIQVEDLAIDFFKPSASISEHSKKIYVIASKMSFLKTIVDAARKAFLNPVIIDIQEFALRNLLSFIDKGDETMACLHLLENKSIFFILNKNEIHLVRHIAYGVSKFMGDEMSYDVIMEIKHTLDYYFHQLNKTPPEKVFIPSMNNYCIADLGKLKTALGLEAKCLTVDELSIFNNVPKEQLKPDCYIALGGELRGEKKAS